MDSYSIAATTLIVQNSFAGLNWTAIKDNFVGTLIPGRYLLRKDNWTDPSCYIILTSIKDKSSSQVKLYVTDKMQYNGETGDTKQALRKKVINELLNECLMYNMQVDTLAAIIQGKLFGDSEHHENLLSLKLESINDAILKEFDSFALVNYHNKNI